MALIVAACCLSSVFALPAPGAAGYAQAYITGCSGKDVQTVIAETEKVLQQAFPAGSEKKEVLSFLAECYERLSRFQDAAKTWNRAATAAGNVPRDDRCLIRAALCAANQGDRAAAETYLSPVLMTATDPQVLSSARLASVWIAAADEKQTEAAALLESYLASPDGAMRQKRSAILFSLWYITGEKKWSDTLQKEFPDAPETLVAAGKAQLVPGNFWYFLPRNETATIGRPKETPAKPETPPDAAPDSPKTQNAPTEKTGTGTFWQTGFYKNQEYADAMAKKLQELGFTPVIRRQKRASGTEYIAVGVMEASDGSTAPALRNAGIECSPVFEK